MGTTIQLSIFLFVSSSGFAQAVNKPQIPVADYDDSSQDSAQPAELRARHLRRDAHYDKFSFGPLSALDNPGAVVEPITHWNVRLPAIPAAQSNLIVVGEVISASDW